MQVISLVMKREIPTKLSEASVEGTSFKLLWDWCERCWSYEPTDRPAIADVSVDLTVSRDLRIAMGLTANMEILRASAQDA